MKSSFHSVGTLPVDHTMPKSLCSASLSGFSANFNNSGAMPSGPAAFPFFRRCMARVTSARVGVSVEIYVSRVADEAASSRSGLNVADGWLRVA